MSSGGTAATPARRAAYEVVRRVFEHDAWADRSFPAAAERHSLDGRERAQAQRLAYGTVQRRGTLDHIAGLLTKRGVDGLDDPVVAALRLGLFEILFSEASDHAAVDGGVELAKGGMRRTGGRRAAGAAGMVNAVLRRAVAERQALLAALSDESPKEAAVAHSVPEWLAVLWWQELGAEGARALLHAMNEPPETAMRVNALRAEPRLLRSELDAAGERLAPEGDGGLLQPAEALVWEGPLGEAARSALGAGSMFAQSRGAQAVVGVLAPEPGEKVLDLCAGPGVKTVAIAAAMNGEGEVVALERDPARARQIEELAARAGAQNVRVLVADAATGTGSGPGQGYDRVLVDPPCSGLGTLASRPDARWRKEHGDIERLARTQSEIFERAVGAVRPGGTLVYSTCTISKAENEAVVAGMLRSHEDMECVRVVETRPDLDRTDGFYIAQLRKAGSDG